ncbi:protein eiger isoform X4 [Rhagoletis pomonella]|uniref:protein eiger isoform X4 n=1 Tax=Rhagoletis pomonella TaxID=28610 RepID=UPI00177FB2EA|nr:protein eiger isoform X4 [Rhagoletis pomonella]
MNFSNMTTETLKPFILAPHCADNSLMRTSAASRQRSFNTTSIILSALAVILTLIFLGFTHNPDFIDKPTIFDNGENELIDDEDNEDIDEEDYETEFDYEEFRKKLAAMNYDDDLDNKDENDEAEDSVDGIPDGDDKDDASEDEMDMSDEGDFYSDFSKFNSTRRKKIGARKPRSIKPDQSSEDHKRNTTFKIKSRTSENEKESNYQQREILMLRLPSHRSKVSEVNIDQKSSANREVVKKHSHRHHVGNRRYKNAIVKSAKSSRQILPATNTPAAHFHLNRKIPDRYASIRVDSYSGDMYIGHPSWANEIDVDNYFRVENGVLTIREPGLYYVYAQVCYNNTHDQNGFVIFHGHKPFLQCLNTVPTNMPHKIHTCHTSGLIYLKENETIHLRDFHSDRNVILKDVNNRSYFGLIKI